MTAGSRSETEPYPRAERSAVPAFEPARPRPAADPSLRVGPAGLASAFGAGGWALAATVLLALALRVAAVIGFAGTIDGEGAEYLSLAENLLAGEGFVGISTPGVNLFFPPLFPMAIAALAILAKDVHVAGQILSILVGGALTIPVFYIARELYGRATGLMAALLVALHPFLISLATMVQVESTYSLGILTAIALTLQAFRVRTASAFLAAGAVFGLSYLVRGEALAVLLVTAGLMGAHSLITRSMPAALLARRLAVLLLVCGLVATPYVAWLSAQVGTFKLEAKSPLNITVQRAKQAGIGEYGGAFLIGPDLKEEGVFNQDSRETIRSFSMRPSELVDYLVSNTRERLGNTLRVVTTSATLGYPLLVPLVLLGLFSSAWSRRTWPLQFTLLALVGLSVFATYFIYFTSLRFFVVILLCLCIWAAAGIGRIGRWGRETADALGLPGRLSAVARPMALVLATLALLAPPAFQIAGVLFYTRDTRTLKQQAEALSPLPGRTLRMAATSTVPAFHADAEHIWLPYTSDEATALRYLELKQADYVIVRGEDAAQAPYLARWVREGIRDPRARLVSRFTVGDDRLQLYRFTWK